MTNALLCACGCGTPLKKAAYPSQQTKYVKNHNPSGWRKPEAIAARFWSNVQKTDSCWNWTGKSYFHYGYGKFNVNKKETRAHRYSWELHKGAIPQGLFVLHNCDNPKCVNPEHLRLGTQKDNVQDQFDRGRHRHQKGRAA